MSYCKTNDCERPKCHRCFPREGCELHEKCQDYTRELAEERAEQAKAQAPSTTIHCPKCQGTAFFVQTKGEPLMHTDKLQFDFNKRYAYNQYECANAECKHVVTTEDYDLWERLHDCEARSG